MIVSSRQLVANAKQQIESISVEQAKVLLGDDDTIFFDIRDVRELEQSGRIPGAVHSPRGMLEFWADRNGQYHREEFSSGKKLVLFCAAGWRSALAAKTLMDMGLDRVCDLDGGFSAWEQAGGKIEGGPPRVPADEKLLDARPAQARNVLGQLGHGEPGHGERLAAQIGFILEIDKLKQIWRQTPLLDGTRKENDAEHSWQLAMMVLVLSEYAPAEIDLTRVLKMVLIHDIVEIDAGDSPAYTGVTKADQFARETRAADRLFGVLPDDLGGEFRALWDEFEEQASPDALFARAMDRLQPFLHNFFTDGEMWIKHKIRQGQVRQRMAIVGQSAPALHKLIEDLIEESVRRNYLAP
jgi:5'-deoxynucleotidase YfbR-like HD superfamily hydrolase/rhodanese-related sulfurtransferase